MLASVLGSLAALASMAVTLALCYLFWRKRSAAKEAKDELEPLQVGGPAPSAQATPKGGVQPQQQQGKGVVEQTKHNADDRLYQGTTPSSTLSLDKNQRNGKKCGTVEDQCPKSIPSEKNVGNEKSCGVVDKHCLTSVQVEKNLENEKPCGLIEKCCTKLVQCEKNLINEKLCGVMEGYCAKFTQGEKASKSKCDNKATATKPGSSASTTMLAMLGGNEDDYDEVDTSEPLEPAGQIQFSLEYDFYASTLVLRIIQGRDLPAKDIIGTSDPYVKVTLLPDKKRKLETKVKHRTLNPRWNETFYFEGFPLHKLQKSILHLNVYDWDRFSRDDPIGDVYLPLAQVDLTQKPTFWKALKPAETCKLGDLLVSLMYVPRTSELSIGFIKARKLKAKDITGASDPYVKVWLMRGEKRLEKYKTPVFKCTLNPVFNEVFTFIVSWEHIRETSLAITVMDWDNVGRNEPIGGIVLGSKTGPTESKHWGEMLTKPRTPVLQWHKLKPL